MARTFITSDTHFGHENIIRYANRPFGSSAEMNEAMIERWNARVGISDTVYFLGDFAMGRGVTAEFIVQILSRLNGEKTFILGNHDQPSKHGPGLNKIIMDYELDDILVIHDQIVERKFDGQYFVMCHYPLADWDGKHHGTVHLHGHAHSQYKKSAVHNMIASRRYDIGVDMYGGPIEVTGDLRYLNDPKGWL